MLQLHDYQAQDLGRIHDALRRHRRVIYQLPTGGGKTVLAAALIAAALDRGERVWFICHRQELIDQTALTFDRLGFPYSFIAAGYPYSEFPVQIASIDTLKGRMGKYAEPDIAVWDEAHHSRAKGWQKVFTALRLAKHVGLTATPLRLDGKGLGLLFEHLICGPTVGNLIERGFLSEYICWAPPSIDRSKLHMLGGDFQVDEAEEEARKIVGDLPGHYLEHAKGKLALAFGTTIRHSKEIVSAFNRAGIPAAHLDGKTKKHERREILQRFARREVHVVSNVGLFGEGFDVAANSGMDVTVEAVIGARPTASLSLWLQQCGRALRRKDTPAVILDHAGNALVHGLPDDPREWDLVGDGLPSDGVTDYKQCPQCFIMCKKHLRFCPNKECGPPPFDFSENSKGRKPIEHIEGELEELGKYPVELPQVAPLAEWVRIALRRRQPNPYHWAAKQFTEQLRRNREGIANTG